VTAPASLKPHRAAVIFQSEFQQASAEVAPEDFGGQTTKCGCSMPKSFGIQYEIVSHRTHIWGDDKSM
jgi:hypothetical protein